MTFDSMRPGMLVQHRNGLRGDVDDLGEDSFAVIWHNAGRVVYPAEKAKEFEPR